MVCNPPTQPRAAVFPTYPFTNIDMFGIYLTRVTLLYQTVKSQRYHQLCGIDQQHICKKHAPLKKKTYEKFESWKSQYANKTCLFYQVEES